MPNTLQPQHGDAERSSLLKINGLLQAQATAPDPSTAPAHGDAERRSLVKINQLLYSGVLIGPPGPPGPPGGASASTTLTATFTMPAVNATAVASVASATAFAVGAVVYVAPVGYLGVTATATNQLTLKNLGYTTNQAPGSTAASGNTVTGSGPQGPAGTAATITAGTTATLAPGNAATVTNVGSSSAAIFNFGIPQGVAGAAGLPGMVWRGAWSGATAYNVNDVVSQAGSSYICIVANTGNTPPNATYWQLVAQIGGTGPTGPSGPTAVSVNANNKATLGTDSLILVQGVAAGASATTHAQTVSGDDPQLTNARTPTAHQATHVTGSDQIPSASVSARGLLAQLSGNTTDYVGGDNTCHPLPVRSFISKTAAYTLTAADSGIYVICSGGSWTLTLPTSAVGLVYHVRNDQGISGTTGTITLQPTGGTIDGQSSLALLPQQECTLITDGSNWRTRGLKREVILGTQDITSSTASGIVLLPVGYRFFDLQFSGMLPVTDNDYCAGQLSINGGSTWITTGYYHGVLNNNSTTTVVFTDVENGSSFYIKPQGSNTASVPAGSRLILFPGNATQAASWTVDAGGRNNAAYQVKWNGTGLVSGGGVVNALKYFMFAGNIANSFLTVKGVV